jgi:hypothetical protein
MRRQFSDPSRYLPAGEIAMPVDIFLNDKAQLFGCASYRWSTRGG